MALDDLERKRVEKAVNAFLERRRPPPPVRPQLDLGYRISGQSVELFEVRPRWDKPDERTERAFAKATYVRTMDLWKVYWVRADLKWHAYQPDPVADDIKGFLAVVDRDGCFWG